MKKYKVKDRILVMVNDQESYLATITNIGNNKIHLLYDDGDEGKISLNSDRILGKSINKKRKLPIPKRDVGKYLLKNSIFSPSNLELWNSLPPCRDVLLHSGRKTLYLYSCKRDFEAYKLGLSTAFRDPTIRNIIVSMKYKEYKFCINVFIGLDLVAKRVYDEDKVCYDFSSKKRSKK